MSKLDDYKSELAVKTAERTALETKLESAKEAQRSSGREIQDLLGQIKEIRGVQEGLKTMITRESKLESTEKAKKHFADFKRHLDDAGARVATAAFHYKEAKPEGSSKAAFESEVKSFFENCEKNLTASSPEETKVTVGVDMGDSKKSSSTASLWTVNDAGLKTLIAHGEVRFSNTQEEAREVKAKPVWSEADIRVGAWVYNKKGEVFRIAHYNVSTFEWTIIHQGTMSEFITLKDAFCTAEYLNYHGFTKEPPQEVEKPFVWTAKDIPYNITRLMVSNREGNYFLSRSLTGKRYYLDEQLLEQRTPYGVAAFLNSEGFKPGWTE